MDDILLRRDYFTYGDAYGWGYNGGFTGDGGPLGDNTNSSRLSPVTAAIGKTDWKQISISKFNAISSGIDNSGKWWYWGNLIPGVGLRTSSPVTIPYIANTTWRQVDCGNNSLNYNFIMAIKTDGTLWGIGYSTNGQLGDGTTTTTSSPVSVKGAGNANTWLQVACGTEHTIALQTNGTLWTWGTNGFGQLGDNTTSNRSLPVSPLGTSSNTFVQVAAGQYNSAAIQNNGNLWMWGDNTYYAVSANTLILSAATPVLYAGPNNFGTAYGSWKTISIGSYTQMGIQTDGTLWAWGNGFNGAIGDGTSSIRSVPVQIAGGGTNWKTVSIGQSTALATKTDGTVWVWGEATSGALGNGTTTPNVSSPISLALPSGQNWKQVSMGGQLGLAIRDATT
jgi:alpha-tubulin suppressor-like RCC1 family protein